MQRSFSSTDKNGESVDSGAGAGQYNNSTWWTAASTWSTASGAFEWKFGTDEANPWKWDDGKSLPVLWFE